MFLNNFIKWLSYFPSKTSTLSTSSGQAVNNYEVTQMVNTSGLTRYMCYTNHPVLFSTMTLSIVENPQSSNMAMCIEVVVGRGTTPPTPEDYKLEDMITSGIIGLTGSLSYPKAGALSITYGLTNTSEETITISEIGLRMCGYSSTSATSNSNTANDFVLLTRDVLDEPIVIPPGETKSFTYTLDYTKING